MNQKIDVYGLSEQQHRQLREIALTKYGKASTSLLAKNLLLELLEPQIIEIVIKKPQAEDAAKKHRIVARLLAKYSLQLEAIAEQQHMSVNALISAIIAAYISKQATFGNTEIETLRQSNHQLLRIGRNLNQIARLLNIGESMSLSSEKIDALQQFINNHTSRVSDVLAANKRRYS